VTTLRSSGPVTAIGTGLAAQSPTLRTDSNGPVSDERLEHRMGVCSREARHMRLA